MAALYSNCWGLSKDFRTCFARCDQCVTVGLPFIPDVQAGWSLVGIHSAILASSSSFVRCIATGFSGILRTVGSQVEELSRSNTLGKRWHSCPCKLPNSD
jgi:hypothetical protein